MKKNPASKSGPAVTQQVENSKELAEQKWMKQWEHYLSTVFMPKRTPAHDGDLGRRRDKLQQGLRKAESSLAISGLERQHFRHFSTLLGFLPWSSQRMYEAAGTDRYQEILSRPKRGFVRWWPGRSGARDPWRYFSGERADGSG